MAPGVRSRLGAPGPGRARGPSAVGLYARYLLRLLWEFRGSLAVFWGLVLVGGLILTRFYHDQDLSYPEACYGVFLLIFIEPYLPFPKEWYLQPLFFLLPIIGLGAVAESLVRLGYLVFSRKNRLPEWQRMMASLHRNHTVVVGVGKVGYAVVRGLLDLGEPVVVVERATEGADGPLVEEVVDWGVPILRGDGRATKTLEQAGVAHARAVILATSDDLANLDAGLTARDLNPHARIVLRLFDESLAAKVRGAFAMPAISTARVAAPAFIAAATGRRLYQDFELGGRHLHLIDLTVHPDGRLVGRTVGDIQGDSQVNIVMHHQGTCVNVNPGHDLRLAAGDEILVIAPLERLHRLERENEADSARPS
jgi:Trk K+ transport system NAD-binding subunit